MAKIPSDYEPSSWHRYFAIESNNRAWDLSERDRDVHEDLEMVTAALLRPGTGRRVGTELHQVRSLMLLSRVYALVGERGKALELATTVRALLPCDETARLGSSRWFMPSYAHANTSTATLRRNRDSYAQALAALATLTSEEDRKIVLATLNRIPKP
jgi:hypothetical protein